MPKLYVVSCWLYVVVKNCLKAWKPECWEALVFLIVPVKCSGGAQVRCADFSEIFSGVKVY